MIYHLKLAYLQSVLMLAMGWSSSPCSWSSKLKSHNSSFVSSEKSASTAPALVPVTTRGLSAPGLQAKAAVLGILRSPTILAMCWVYTPTLAKGLSQSSIPVKEVGVFGRKDGRLRARRRRTNCGIMKFGKLKVFKTLRAIAS